MRAGHYVKQLEGYRAFVPAPLPPVPPLEMDRELTRRLSEADHALGRLDGVTLSDGAAGGETPWLRVYDR